LVGAAVFEAVDGAEDDFAAGLAFAGVGAGDGVGSGATLAMSFVAAPAFVLQVARVSGEGSGSLREVVVDVHELTKEFGVLGCGGAFFHTF